MKKIVNAPCIARNSRLWFHKDPKEIAVRAADAELVLATRCDLEIDLNNPGHDSRRVLVRAKRFQSFLT